MPEDYFLDEEVIGSYTKYHRPFCHIVKNIDKRNRKRLRNWQEAVVLGLTPCSICRPFYPDHEPHPQKKKIGF